MSNKLDLLKLSGREIKLLSKSKKNLKDYVKNRIEPNKDKMQEVFGKGGGSLEFKDLENQIVSIYESSSKANKFKNNLIKKMYENNYIYNFSRKMIEIGEICFNYKLPILDDDMCYTPVAPKLYAVYEITTKDYVGVGFSLTPNWSYSGSLDSYDNLLRASGYIPEVAYRHRWLEADLGAYTSCNLRFNNELEALTYIYDHMPYAARFGKKKWLNSLLLLNRSGGTVIGWRPELRPMRLRGSEHITLSSRCIPFEIEGHLIVITVERLIEITRWFRLGRDHEYNYGDCDSPKKVLLAILLSHAGFSDDHLKEVIEAEDVTTLVKIIRGAKESESVTTEEIIKKEDPVEVAYYHATSEQREAITAAGLLEESKAAIIRVSHMLGFRTIFYRNSLDLIDRYDAAERLSEFNVKEDKLIDEFNSSYGYNVLREGKDVVNGPSIDVLDADDSDADFFGMFDEQPEYDLPEDEASGGDAIFAEQSSQWISRSKAPEGAAIRIWDPGIVPEDDDSENPRSLSLLGLM